jgi:Uma2 family endonuclease
MGSLQQNRPLTVEDLYGIPDDGYRYELINGLLVSEPLPGGRHGMVAATVAGELRRFARKRRRGVTLTGDVGFILQRSPDTVRGPDVAFVTRERYEALEDASQAIPGPPDLAVEVVSPHDRLSDVHAKVADYLVAGTRVVWVVDPSDERVTVYRKLLEPCVLGANDELTAEDVLPGFHLRVRSLFEI